MKNIIYHPDSDLWKGEQAIFADIVQSVPDGGVIVEIGTSKGGTTALIHTATKGRNIKIYTVDIAPQAKTYENLKDTAVNIIVQPSAEAAGNWQTMTGGGKIDMLFIDGDHEFKHVFEDFNMWIPHLRPKGLVVFHDYDPVERGGLVHFGVKICVDTIRRADILKKSEHKYKLFYGMIENPKNASVNVEECWQTFENLEQHISSVLKSDFSDRILVADDRFSLFVNGCLHGKLKAMVLPQEVRDPDCKYLVSGHPVSLPLYLMEARNIPYENITILDSVIACCLLEKGLKENFDYLYKINNSPATLTRWCELLDMLDKGYGKVSFYDKLYGIGEIPPSLNELSKLIARLQFRLNILARMLKTFVDWTP
jgi:hypothetical protein